MRRGGIAAVLLVAAGAGRAAGAQVLTAAAFVSSAEHRVDAGYGVERSSGLLGGGRVSVSLPPRVSLGLTAGSGSLDRDSTNAEERRVAEIGLDARYRTLPWLWLETGVATRTYSALIATQRWTSLRLGAEARVPFLSGRVEGLGRLLFLPVVSVTGLDQPDLAVAAGAGLAYRVGPITAELSYAVERYDFPARDGIPRAEQLSTLTVSAAARLFGLGSR